MTEGKNFRKKQFICRFESHVPCVRSAAENFVIENVVQFRVHLYSFIKKILVLWFIHKLIKVAWLIIKKLLKSRDQVGLT